MSIFDVLIFWREKLILKEFEFLHILTWKFKLFNIWILTPKMIFFFYFCSSSDTKILWIWLKFVGPKPLRSIGTNRPFIWSLTFVNTIWPDFLVISMSNSHWEKSRKWCNNCWTDFITFTVTRLSIGIWKPPMYWSPSKEFWSWRISAWPELLVSTKMDNPTGTY